MKSQPPIVAWSGGAILVTLLALAEPARPDGFEPVDQIRGVGASVWAFECNPEWSDDGMFAEGFGPFVASVDVSEECEGVGAIARAQQVSTIDETVLTAAGSAYSETHYEMTDLLLATSASTYLFCLDLAASARVRIDGVLTAGASAEEMYPSLFVVACVAITQGFDVFFEQELQPELNAPPVEATVEHVLRLEPGSYSVTARAVATITDAVTTTGVFESSFDFIAQALNVADLDASGLVDVVDLVELILAWGPCEGCPADIDLSGAVDVQDLVALVLAWGATGPC